MIDRDEKEKPPYDTINISEFTINRDGRRIQYPCPCGDLFELSLERFAKGEKVARCPTCSLTVLIEYDSLDAALAVITTLAQTDE